jgi:hypothetical protein
MNLVMCYLHTRVVESALVNEAEYFYIIDQQPRVADLSRSHFSQK